MPLIWDSMCNTLFEPRYATIEQTVQTTEDILRSYPRLNALEMITEETGGWGIALHGRGGKKHTE